MSPVAVGLDLLLIALLVAALAFGVRLDRRLKTLRESQAGFAQAVAELDAAAGRAEAGLSTLRATTEDARAELTERLDEARSLVRRLERLSFAAPPEAAPPPRHTSPASATADPVVDQTAELAAALRELRRRRSAAS